MTITPASNHETGQQRCTNCGDFFFCGISGGNDACWCFLLPRVMPVGGTTGATGCMCHKCLRASISHLRPDLIRPANSAKHEDDL